MCGWMSEWRLSIIGPNLPCVRNGFLWDDAVIHGPSEEDQLSAGADIQGFLSFCSRTSEVGRF